MRCTWKLAKTQLGVVLEYFRSDAIGICLRHNLGLSWNIWNLQRRNMELSWHVFDSLDWNLAKAQFGIVLEYFR